MGTCPGARGNSRQKGVTPAARLVALIFALVALPALARPAGTEALANPPPYVTASLPLNGATSVRTSVVLSVTFSEPVSLGPEAMSLVCAKTPNLSLAVSAGPTTYTMSPSQRLAPGDQCVATVFAQKVTDFGDPTASMTADYYWAFTTDESDPPNIVINEVDAVVGPYGHEFIELYDGGVGRTALDGLQVALYSGDEDILIMSLVLAGFSTDANGYFLISSDPTAADLLIANGALLDGPAAVALYDAPGNPLPFGSPPLLDGLLDAIVYDSGQADDAGLLALILPGEPQVDEGALGQAAAQANQRCPNGAGGQRRTTAYRQGAPTPGTANTCPTDTPPDVIALSPAANSTVDPATLKLGITFGEPVALASGAVELVCDKTGKHALEVTGGPSSFTVTLQSPPDYGETCAATIFAHLVSDLDTVDPPNLMVSDVTWSFKTSKRVATEMLINEVDSDTSGVDTAEFIELYDGGIGNTDLSGLVLVLYNGGTDKSYRAMSLDGYATDPAGYFLAGNQGVAGRDLVLPDAVLQNGPDAVALYAARATDFPNGTPVTTNGIVDAVVYGPATSPDAGLLKLLEAGQAQVDEDSGDAVESHSSQRCPNGAGGQRMSASFRQHEPTPGAANTCPPDSPPQVTATIPPANAAGVATSASLTVTFNEPVKLAGGWFQLACATSGTHATVVSGGPETWFITISTPLAPAERCEATVLASKVTDTDTVDPPDTMAADFRWSFTTASLIATNVLINEADTNTPGVDKAEFIELFDGGVGNTSLNGLTVVLYNGSSDTSYFALELDGQSTDKSGYLVIGNAAVPGVDLVVVNGLVQNGPDAVALFAAPATAFPANSPVTTAMLVDALVYGEGASSKLLSLLNANQPVPDEGSFGAADIHSMQRCSNGSGGARNTLTVGVGLPTPGTPNACLQDDAPRLISVSPSDGTDEVALDSELALTFSEPVALVAGSVTIKCSRSGDHTLTISGGPINYTLASSRKYAHGETCDATLKAEGVSDLDTNDPPDQLASDFSWQFETVAPVAGIILNEFDVDTPGVDTAEFIELYDGGRGNLSLDGLVVVLFNGQGDVSYKVIDLSGTTTDAQGYLVIGGPDVAGRAISLAASTLQNGPDAIALYAAPPMQFPPGTPIKTKDLLDAVVYATADPVDPGLMALLPAGAAPIDESSRGDPATDANQRCPNGSGGALNTSAFRQGSPTPGAGNACAQDTAPEVVSVSPPDGATGVSSQPTLTIAFSEPVTVQSGWLLVNCVASGAHNPTIAGGPTTYTAHLAQPLVAGETCTGKVVAAKVRDADASDPPDTLATDKSWSFTVAADTCHAPTIPIASIQGPTDTSPLTGQTVTTSGMLTADFRKQLGGIFVQTGDQLATGTPGASHGLFVVFGKDPGSVAVGEELVISGIVAEVNKRTTLTQSMLIAKCGDSSNSVSPHILAAAPETPAGWESLESMLVTIGSSTIVDNEFLWLRGELGMVSGKRPIFPTEVQPPGPDAYATYLATVSRSFVLADPAGYLEDLAAGLERAGNTTPNLTGVVDGQYGARRVTLTQATTVQPANLRTDPPAPIADALRVVATDVGYLTNGNGTGGGFADPAGASSAAEYARQKAKIAAMLVALEADVIAIVGLEPDGFGELSTARDLLHEINALAEGSSYALASSTPTPANPDYPRQVAVIYRQASVSAIAAPMAPAPDVKLGFQAQPITVALTDSSSGDKFELLLIHLATRADCPTSGPDADQQDGQECHNASRAEAAAALKQALATDDPSRTIVLGNWNAFGHEDPIQIVLAAGLSDLTPASVLTGDVDYTQIVGHGHSGATLRPLAGESIAGQFQQVTVWHVNADESAARDYRLDNPPELYAPDPLRAAPTDPLVIDLTLGQLKAKFTTLPAVFIGETSRFQNLTTGPGPIQFSWDFGDRSPTVAARDPAHTYERIGTYTVTLSAKNAHGTVQAFQTVDVLPRRAFLPATASDAVDTQPAWARSRR